MFAYSLIQNVDQQLGEHANFPSVVLAVRMHDVDAAFGYRIVRHHRHQGAGCQMLLDEEVGKRGEAEPGDGRSSNGDDVIGLEPALWNRDRPVAVDEAPAFRALASPDTKVLK